MRITSFCLLALATGCTEILLLDNTGTACVDEANAEVFVDFQTCMSSSCNTVLSRSCTATVDGDTLVVTSAAEVESQTGPGNCTLDCMTVSVACDLPEGWEATTTLSYGGETQAVDVACETF
jgi:hypothetical protein